MKKALLAFVVISCLLLPATASAQATMSSEQLATWSVGKWVHLLASGNLPERWVSRNCAIELRQDAILIIGDEWHGPMITFDAQHIRMEAGLPAVSLIGQNGMPGAFYRLCANRGMYLPPEVRLRFYGYYNIK